ncbi:hypothetical protein GCM10023205_69020 [Yinghuangia aomiensis]|uniref:Uncharacterized protein n=2 Tax=Kitasatosporales TaxID=85011 RepID=A0ABP9I4T1_9ACTN
MDSSERGNPGGARVDKDGECNSTTAARGARRPPGAVLEDSRAGRTQPEPAGVPRPRRSVRGETGQERENRAAPDPLRDETSAGAADSRKISGESCNAAGARDVQGSAGIAREADLLAAETVDGAAVPGTARTEPVRPDEVAMTRTLDAYAIRLAALKAYDITGVRPRELHRYRAYGEVPDGLSEEIVQRAQKIVEEERARLLRLAGS